MPWLCLPAHCSGPMVSRVAGSNSIASGVSVMAIQRSPSRVTFTLVLSVMPGLKTDDTRWKIVRHGSLPKVRPRISPCSRTLR